MKIEEIVAIRKYNGIKQYEFAEYINVPIGTWSNVETKKQPLYSDVRAKAVKALKELGCDFSILSKPELFSSLPKKIYSTREKKEEESVKVETTGEAISEIAIVQEAFPHQPIPIEGKLSSFHLIAQEIGDTLVKKNHDYGDSFFDVYKRFGDISTYIRLSDKLGRMSTLINETEQIKDEPLEDVLRDIAGYCILTLESKQRLKQQQEG